MVPLSCPWDRPDSLGKSAHVLTRWDSLNAEMSSWRGGGIESWNNS